MRDRRRSIGRSTERIFIESVHRNFVVNVRQRPGEKTTRSTPKILFSTCLSSRESRHSYLSIGRTAESVPRGVHRPNELQQLSPLADSRCSYLNNIPNSLASLTRYSPASHHTDREYRTTFFQGRTSSYSGTFERNSFFAKISKRASNENENVRLVSAATSEDAKSYYFRTVKSSRYRCRKIVRKLGVIYLFPFRIRPKYLVVSTVDE